MPRPPLFTDVYETDTFNQWRLKTNSIKLNLEEVYSEIDNLPNLCVLLTGNQSVAGVKTYTDKSVWTSEYTKNAVTPMLQLKVTNHDTPVTNTGNVGTGPAIDFYNPDTTAGGGQDTWLSSRISSECEHYDDRIPNASLVFYTGKNIEAIAEKMRITSDGRVGIGTSAPTSLLTMSDLVNDAFITIRSKESKAAGLYFGDDKSASSGSIRYYNTGNSMRFFTGEGANTGERLRITSAGNVGIGITSPTQKLDVYGNIKSRGWIEAGDYTGGVALTLNDGYGNSNVTFNHNAGKPTVNGSSGRIRCDVDETVANMEFQLKNSSVAGSSAIDLEKIVRLTTSKVSLFRSTDVNGKLYTSGRVGIGEQDPDMDLCIGNKSTEAGSVSINSIGGFISLRPLKNTSGAWLLNAHDAPAGAFDISHRKVKGAGYSDTAVLRAYSNRRVDAFGKLGVAGATFSTADGIPPTANLSVNGPDDESVSAQFRGTIQVNQQINDSRGYAFLSTNVGEALVGGNLRLDGELYKKGTVYRSSAAIKFSTPTPNNSNGGEIIFLRSNDTNNSNFTVTENARFDERGNFGLGVSQPTQKLDVSGNIKGTGLLYLGNDRFPQVVLADANLQDKRFGIWKENTNDSMAIGPQSTTGYGYPSVRFYRDRTINILVGGKVEKVLNHDHAIVNRKYVQDAIINADISSSLTSLSINRISTSEGGALAFKRTTDNTDYWTIDTAAGSTPDLRFNANGNEVVSFTSAGKASFKGNFTPDWDLCVGNSTSEAGHVAFTASGGAISLRPEKNTTSRWMVNAIDSTNGSLSISNGKWNSVKNKYDDQTVLGCAADKTVTAYGNLQVNGSVNVAATCVIQGWTMLRNPMIMGKISSESWLLNPRRDNKGDYFELVRRKDDDSGYKYGEGFRQMKDGNVGIGTSPASGYKLDVNGNINVRGTITQYGKIKPSNWGGGLTTYDIYSDGGTIGVGNAGTLQCWLDREGKAYIKNKLTLGYTPTSATDAVSKSYVDTAIQNVSTSGSSSNKFYGNQAINIGTLSKIVTPAGNEIPKGVGNHSHGTNFVAKFETSSSGDGGGIFIDISDGNHDEHAISVYNTNVDREVFHVRSTSGDTYVGRNLFAADSIGAAKEFTYGTKTNDYWSTSVNGNNNFTINKNGTTKFRIDTNGRITLLADPTADMHAATKQYVDSQLTGLVSANGSSNLTLRNSSPTIYLKDTDHISTMIRQNSNLFYILRADSKDDSVWTTYTTSDSANAKWPLTIDVTNSSHSFNIGSPNVTAGGSKVWHAGNHGANSGLDADKLDGKHANDFALKSHNHDSSYIKKSGGVFSGDIEFRHDGGGINFWRNTDSASIKFYNTGDGDTNCRLEFLTGDNNNEYFLFAHKPSGGAKYDLLKIHPTHLHFKGNKVWHAGNDGSGSGLDADKLDGRHAGDFALRTDYYDIISGSSFAGNFSNIIDAFDSGKNYFDVYPPTGRTMSDLVAFIPSIKRIHFQGNVNYDDSIRCEHQIRTDRIRVFVQNTEQRSQPAANYLGVWKKA